jgi:hypothetical protein
MSDFTYIYKYFIIKKEVDLPKSTIQYKINL